jgi:hypothetical protein
MTREDDMVEPFSVQEHAVKLPGHSTDGRVYTDTIPKGGYERFDIARRASSHHPPLRPIVDGQHPVLAEEPYEELHGHFEHAAGRGRPERRAHRDEIVFGELW